MNKVKKKIILFLLMLIAVFSVESTSIEAASNYDEGEYNLPFTVLKGDSNERSMTNDYLKSPGKLIVKNGKNIVQLTLKNSSWWKSFHIQSKPVTVVSESNDTRVVQFDVADLNQILDANIHVVVPDIDYDNKYNIRFQFDTSSLKMGDKTSSPANNESKNNVEAEKQSTDGTKHTGNKSEPEKNPKTSDNTPVFLLTATLFASGFVILRKISVK
ncbi:heme uptake protein IsdC [Virgibacillus sp.]|uniref:heme uptake protein IsdC n=1 Tax=Virgibacillus sp. TaxID=1872700 RepID=UPI000989EB43|nr:heme uptake protein IsdC [Virgibacillus sp.]